MSDDTRPLVSIGLPVYNGEKHVAVALQSLLAQDYPRFELIISDNASTDATETICRAAAARDSRVRYFRATTNQGAIHNFNRVFELSHGELFAWAAHDDLWEPTFVSRCVDAFMRFPDAVLVHTQAHLIDDSGARIGQPIGGFLTERSSRRALFREVIHAHWSALAAYALIRRSALDRTDLYQPFLGADYVLLAQLSLLGRFVEVPEPLWSYRTHAFDHQYYERVKRALSIEKKWTMRHAPWASLCAKFVDVALKAELPARERLALAAEALRWYGLSLHGFPALRKMAVWAIGESRHARLMELLRHVSLYRALRGIPHDG